MIDARNIVVLSGGLTRDPERVGDNIVKFGLGVDYASNDKQNPSGYFDVTYFLSQDTQNTKFVKGQLAEGNFKKGSAISVVGRLSQDRWEKDGQKFSRVIVIADSISYYGRKQTDAPANGAAATPKANASVGAPSEEETSIPPGEF